MLMKNNRNGINLTTHWRFWGLHFGIHMIMGLLACIAGVVVIFTVGEVLNGLALVGAGSFAIINGWQGFMELGKNAVNQLYRTSNQNNR